MAQQSHSYSGPVSYLASNINVNSGASETIILDRIACLGGRNMAVTIFCRSGAVSAVAMYGSPDGINWSTALSGFSTFAVAVNAIGHGEVQANWAYIRITTTGAAVIDAYFNAVQ